MMHLIDIQLNAETLKRYYPLNTLALEDLRDVYRKSRLSNLSRHEVVFKEGSNDDDVIYLISGTIRLRTETGTTFELSADADQALYPIANIKPRRFSASVVSDHAAVAYIPSSLINKLLPKKTAKVCFVNNTMVHHEEDKRILDSDWMMAMQHTPLFRKLPEETVAELFHRMEEKTYKAGDSVITQGELGDYYYLIKQGECQVSRNNGQKDIVLAELGATDSFGEDALLTRARRNASVTMISDGSLMRISKNDFEELLQQALVKWVNPVQATQLLKHGAITIDVRKDSTGHKAFKQALRIPSHLLRHQLRSLSRKHRYLLLCDDSRDSALAAYLFSQRGLDSYILSSKTTALAS